MGPVKAPQRTYAPFVAKKTIVEAGGGDEGDDEDTATLDDESTEDDGAFSGDDSEAQEEPRHKPKSSVMKPMATAQLEPGRRAKRKRTENDLEERYMQRLQEEEDIENKKLEALRKKKQESGATPVVDGDTEEGEDQGSEDSDGGSSSESEDEQEKKKDKGITGTGGNTGLFPIRHETLEPQKHEDLDEAARTVFLGNVPSIVISSKVRLLVLLSCFTSNTG